MTPTFEAILSDPIAGAAFAAHVASDPAGAAAHWLGVDVWPGQRRILDSLFRPIGEGGARTTVVGSGHATGKSFSVALATQLWLARGWPETNVVIFAASETALKERIFRAIEASVTGGRGAMRWGTKPLAGVWAPHPTARVVGQVIRGESEGQQGFHAPGGVLTQVDEASALGAAKYETIVSGLMTGSRDRALLVGNPLHTDGPFADALGDGGPGVVHLSSLESPNIVWARLACYLADGRRYDARDVADEIWAWFPESGRACVPVSRLIPTVQWVWARVRNRGPDWMRAWESEPELVPGLAGPGWLDEVSRKYGTDSDEFRTRVLGLLPETGEDELFSRTAFTEAAARDSSRRSGRRILGGDIGAVGDPTVLYVRDDASVIDRVELRSAKREEWRNQVKAAIRELWEKHDCAEGYLDDTGIGIAIADEIRAESGIRTLWGLAPGGAASDAERFVNQRSELAFRLREWLRVGAIPREWAAELRAQSGIRWETDRTTSRKRLEPKPDFKKRIGRSPDDLDALCYTFGALPGPVAFEAARGLCVPGDSVRFVADGIEVDGEKETGEIFRAQWFNPAGRCAAILGMIDGMGGWHIVSAVSSEDADPLWDWLARVNLASVLHGRPLPIALDVIGYPEDKAIADNGNAFRREMIRALDGQKWTGSVPRVTDRRWLDGPNGAEAINRLVLAGVALNKEDPYWTGKPFEWLRYSVLPAIRVWPREVRDELNEARFEGKKRGADPAEDPEAEFVAGGGPFLRCLRMIAGSRASAIVTPEPEPKVPDIRRYGR